MASENHLKIVKEGGRLKLEPFKAPPSSGQRPSADILFSSAAEACESSLIAILLSGYGQDGVNGMTIVREKGGWSICQMPDDCAFNFNVVAALEEGIVDEVGSRDEIAQKVYARRSASIV